MARKDYTPEQAIGMLREAEDGRDRIRPRMEFIPT